MSANGAPQPTRVLSGHRSDLARNVTNQQLGRTAELNFRTASRHSLAQAREGEFERRAFTQDDGVNPVTEGRLRKQDCGQITDGAAAVVLASPRYAAAHVGRTGRSSTTVVSFIAGR